jgi:AcrR family transcriptional regulator
VASDTHPARAPRADAERNRARILDAATDVFAQRGVGATLNDVARAAGVGVGTVYRKFPDKDALLDALFDAKVDTLVRLAVEAAPIEDAGLAFRSFLLGVIEARATDRGLGTIVMGGDRGERFATELGQRLAPAVRPLIARAQAAGELRDGFTGQDVCFLSLMVGAVADATRDDDPGIWRRYAQMLVDGTRPAASPAPLAPPPLPFPATAAALGRAR